MPVLPAEMMNAAAQVISDVSGLKAVAGHRKAVRCVQPGQSQLLINLICQHTSAKFLHGSCPDILGRASHTNFSGCNGTQKEMLVKGKILLVIRILLKTLTKPISELPANVPDGLPLLAAGDSGTAAAGFIGKYMGEALVRSSGEQSRFSQPGMASHTGPGKVQNFKAPGIIHDPLCRPGPQGDLAGAVRIPFAIREEQTGQTVMSA